MSVTLTINYNLIMPAVGTEIDIWGPYPNSNMVIIDAQMKLNADAAAAAAADAASRVPSVFGRTGAIVAVSSDYNLSLLPDVAAALTLKSDKGVADGNNVYTANTNLGLVDAGAIVRSNGGTNVAFTVIKQATTVWAARTRIDLFRQGTGELAVVADAGVSILSVDGKLRLNKQYSGATLFRIAADNWFLVGDLKT